MSSASQARPDELTTGDPGTADEELTAAVRRLETANAELRTLNAELRLRTGEINQVNAFLESVLMGLHDGVVVVDGDLVVRVWNEQAEQLWGLRAHEAHGRHLLDLDIGLPASSLLSILSEVLTAGVPRTQTVVEAVNHVGAIVRCRLGCTPLISADGDVSGAIVVMDEAGPS